MILRWLVVGILASLAPACGTQARAPAEPAPATAPATATATAESTAPPDAAAADPAAVIIPQQVALSPSSLYGGEIEFDHAAAVPTILSWEMHSRGPLVQVQVRSNVITTHSASSEGATFVPQRWDLPVVPSGHVVATSRVNRTTQLSLRFASGEEVELTLGTHTATGDTFDLRLRRADGQPAQLLAPTTSRPPATPAAATP